MEKRETADYVISVGMTIEDYALSSRDLKALAWLIGLWVIVQQGL